MKQYELEHRLSDYRPSYYRITSPSGIQLVLDGCDPDARNFVEEANKFLCAAQKEDLVVE